MMEPHPGKKIYLPRSHRPSPPPSPVFRVGGTTGQHQCAIASAGLYRRDPVRLIHESDPPLLHNSSIKPSEFGGSTVERPGRCRRASATYGADSSHANPSDEDKKKLDDPNNRREESSKGSNGGGEHVTRAAEEQQPTQTSRRRINLILLLLVLIPAWRNTQHFNLPELPDESVIHVMPERLYVAAKGLLNLGHDQLAPEYRPDQPEMALPRLARLTYEVVNDLNHELMMFIENEIEEWCPGQYDHWLEEERLAEEEFDEWLKEQQYSFWVEVEQMLYGPGVDQYHGPKADQYDHGPEADQTPPECREEPYFMERLRREEPLEHKCRTLKDVWKSSSVGRALADIEDDLESLPSHRRSAAHHLSKALDMARPNPFGTSIYKKFWSAFLQMAPVPADPGISKHSALFQHYYRIWISRGKSTKRFQGRYERLGGSLDSRLAVIDDVFQGIGRLLICFALTNDTEILKTGRWDGRDGFFIADCHGRREEMAVLNKHDGLGYAWDWNFFRLNTPRPIKTIFEPNALHEIAARRVWSSQRQRLDRSGEWQGSVGPWLRPYEEERCLTSGPDKKYDYQAVGFEDVGWLWTEQRPVVSSGSKFEENNNESDAYDGDDTNDTNIGFLFHSPDLTECALRLSAVEHRISSMALLPLTGHPEDNLRFITRTLKELELKRGPLLQCPHRSILFPNITRPHLGKNLNLTRDLDAVVTGLAIILAPCSAFPIVGGQATAETRTALETLVQRLERDDRQRRPQATTTDESILVYFNAAMGTWEKRADRFLIEPESKCRDGRLEQNGSDSLALPAGRYVVLRRIAWAISIADILRPLEDVAKVVSGFRSDMRRLVCGPLLLPWVLAQRNNPAGREPFPLWCLDDEGFAMAATEDGPSAESRMVAEIVEATGWDNNSTKKLDMNDAADWARWKKHMQAVLGAIEWV